MALVLLGVAVLVMGIPAATGASHGALIWSAGPDLPAPRTDAAAVIAPDSALYILGGDAGATQAVHRLRENASAWETAPDIDTPRIDLGAVRSGSQVLLFGGTGNDEGSDETLSYDYQLGDSLDLAKMSTIRYDLGFAADAAGRAYALGGIGVLADGENWSGVIGGVRVVLRAPGPNGEFEGRGDDVFTRMFTAPDGSYLFEGLEAGLYRVAVIDSTLPAGLALTIGSDPTTVDLAHGEHLAVDFGYQ